MAKDKGMNPLAAAAAGAVVGAAVGAAAVGLADPKNRKMVGKKIGEIEKTAEDVKGNIEDFASKVGGRVGDATDDIKKKIK